MGHRLLHLFTDPLRVSSLESAEKYAQKIRFSRSFPWLGYHNPMPLVRLDIHTFRNINSATLQIDPGINLILGPNASGKTSLLEAIYMLGRGRSFRTARLVEVVNKDGRETIVSGHVSLNGRTIPIGLSINQGEKHIRLDGRPIQSRADLLQTFPLQLIHPELYDLLEGSPKSRRQFLDWGVYYSEPDYLATWRQYQRVLNQRNALLKSGNQSTLPFWTQELVKYGKILCQHRIHYLTALQDPFAIMARQLGMEGAFELKYLQGWPQGKDLETALDDDLQRDQKYGFTHSGPHRDDFTVIWQKQPIKNFFSRGQMKLIVNTLAIVQANLIQTPCCLLIDDLTSELDQENQALLANLLVNLKAQIFITTTHLTALASIAKHAGQVFHIAEGAIHSA